MAYLGRRTPFRPRLPALLVSAGAATYTASAAVTIGAATASGSATFTPPVYTASAAVTIGAVTASGSATFSPGTKSGSAAVTIGALTASGSATFSPGTKTATAAVLVGAATASGSATFTPGTKTGTAAVTVGPATASGSATFTAPVYTASAAVSVGAATASGSAVFAAEIYLAAAAVTVGPTTASGSATFTAPIYSGTAAVTTGRATATGSATFTTPVYSGSAAVIIGAIVGEGDATFVDTSSCDYPDADDVRLGVVYGNGAYIGTLVCADPVLPVPIDNLLVHSPADIIRRLLIQAGYGSDPPNLSWPIYAASEPDLPDSVITVFDTAGVDHGRMSVTGDRAEHHGFQIRVRARDHLTGYAKARAISVAMDEVFYQEVVIIAGTTYLVHSLNRTTDVLSIGKQVPNSRRNLFTLNGLTSIKRAE